MRLSWMVTACVLLGTAQLGCKKSPEEQKAEEELKAAEAAAAAELDEAEKALQQETAEAVAGEDADQKPIELTQEQLDKYVVYLKRFNEDLRKDLTEMKAKLKEMEKDKSGGVSAVMKSASAVATLTENRAKHEQSALKAAGLSEREAERIKNVVDPILSARMWSQGADGGTNTMYADSIAQLKQQLKQAKDAETKKQMQTMIAEQEAVVARMMSLADQRSQYGDQNVDLVLKSEGKLMPLHLETMKVGLEAMGGL